MTAMKNYLIILLASAAIIAGGCSKNETPAGTADYGSMRILCNPDAMISTRSEIAVTPVPAAGEFALTITGDDYSHSWSSIPEYNDSQTVLKAGTYTAEISCGDPKAEGVGKAYYHGTKPFQIVARQSTEETIPAQIANSQVLVTTTEAFRNYFHEATFTVTTASGNRFTFTPGSESADEAVFVQAGTRLTLTGKAKLQSQTGTAFDRSYTFPEQTLDKTAARTRHTFCFDARDNGSITLSINLLDEFVEERTINVELNDKSQQVPNA